MRGRSTLPLPHPAARGARLAVIAGLACAAGACALFQHRDWQSELAGDIPVVVHNQTTIPIEVHIIPWRMTGGPYDGVLGRPWGGGALPPGEKLEAGIKPGNYTVYLRGTKPGKEPFEDDWTLHLHPGEPQVIWETEWDLDEIRPGPAHRPEAPPGAIAMTLRPPWRPSRSGSSPRMAAPAGPPAGAPSAEPEPAPAPEREPKPAAACKPDGAEAWHYSECCSQTAYTEEVQDPVSGAWRSGRHLCGKKPPER